MQDERFQAETRGCWWPRSCANVKEGSSLVSSLREMLFIVCCAPGALGDTPAHSEHFVGLNSSLQFHLLRQILELVGLCPAMVTGGCVDLPLSLLQLMTLY